MCTGRASTSQDGTTVGPLQNCYELAKTYLTPDRTISAEGVRKIAAAIGTVCWWYAQFVYYAFIVDVGEEGSNTFPI